MLLLFFFFNDTATTDIYTLSLHALFRSLDVIARDGVIRCHWRHTGKPPELFQGFLFDFIGHAGGFDLLDRKSTRLNSSHANISYAVFCLKKKKTTNT